ncbi:MAG: stage II sporulation protein R [Clostridia bacterium]|nr:stage II sporulation protein R [Clostridia bacterium]
MEKIRLFFTRAPGAAAAVLLSAALALGAVTQYYIDCREVRGDVLRLHVIAASDSEADQAVKLLVRDAVLAEGADLFDGSVTADEAQQRLAPFLDRLEKAADRVLRENGLPYAATAQLVNEYFDVRSYEGVTLPAGRYRALKIVLGEGKGKNWWCVMFPPLCLPAATAEEDAYAVFGGDGAKVVQGEPEYEIRFKIVELVEKAIERIRERRAERID